MNQRTLFPPLIAAFEAHLRNDEKSEATVAKYLHDLRYFADFAGEQVIDKALTVEYKATLSRRFAATSANSMIAALNSFLRFVGWPELCIKQLRVQKQVYCPEDKELTKTEYRRLVETAKARGNERLCLILQTICGTGIRVSELPFITAEAIARGEAVVRCKGKTRTVFIVSALRKKLQRYARERHITTGPLFITRRGAPINRSTVWREMKALCRQADVSPDKVFPHNLRHLFARTFYGIEKDIAKLADILGHTSINTTRIYIITTGAEHKRKLETMHLIL